MNGVLVKSIPLLGQRTYDNQSHSESPWNAALEVWAGQLSLENELLPCLIPSALANVLSPRLCVPQSQEGQQAPRTSERRGCQCPCRSLKSPSLRNQPGREPSLTTFHTESPLKTYTFKQACLSCHSIVRHARKAVYKLISVQVLIITHSNKQTVSCPNH